MHAPLDASKGPLPDRHPNLKVTQLKQLLLLSIILVIVPLQLIKLFLTISSLKLVLIILIDLKGHLISLFEHIHE
jgi:hypothetical protein